jgi:hypothetical protein
MIIVCEISSSHGGEYEAQNLLGCTAVDIQLRTRQYIPEDSELHDNSMFLMRIMSKVFIRIPSPG